MEASFLPVKLLFTSMLPIAVALVWVAILLFLRRKRQISPAWFVPAMCAASLIAPAAAILLSTRHVIRSFQSMAMMGGGIGAASAGLWEASHPLLFALSGALLIVVIAAIAALMPVTEPQAREVQAGGGVLPLIVLPLLSIALAFVPLALFHGTNRLMFDVLSPSYGPSGPAALAQLSENVSRRLVLTSVMSVLIAAILMGIVIVAILAGRRPRPTEVRKLAFLPLMILAAFLILQVVQLRSKMSVFKQTAITGQFPRNLPR